MEKTFMKYNRIRSKVMEDISNNILFYKKTQLCPYSKFEKENYNS